MKKDEILLVAISDAEESGLKPVNLQHLAFHIGQSGIPELEEGYYTFEPGGYGPRSREMDQDLYVMNQARLLRRVCAPGHRWYKTMVSSTEGLEALMRKETRDYVRSITRWAMNKSSTELLASIRETHPEYALNSVFQQGETK